MCFAFPLKQLLNHSLKKRQSKYILRVLFIYKKQLRVNITLITKYVCLK